MQESVKGTKTENANKPREHPPEQFPSRKHQVDPDQPFQEDQDKDRQFAGKEYGEGNYKAAKVYGDATRDFVRSGRVEGADAEPRTGEEAREMAEAETQGRMRSKGEDASAQPASKKRKQKRKR